MLLGGQGAALLLAFAAFAATRLRRPSASDRRLTLLGVPLWQRTLILATQAVALAVERRRARVARRRCVLGGRSGNGARRHALLGRPGAAAAGLLAARRDRRRRRRTRRCACAPAVRALDLVADRRSWSRSPARSRAARRTRTSSCAAAARASCCSRFRSRSSPSSGSPRRAAPRARPDRGASLPQRRLVARLSALSIARRPGAAAAAVAFLTISVGLALFAAAYRATLEQGRRDQAAFALGADLVLREDLSRLVPVREVATPARLRALGRATSTRKPVVRTAANVAGFSGVTGVAVLGLEPSLLHSCAARTSSRPTRRTSKLVGPRLDDRLALRSRPRSRAFGSRRPFAGPTASFERVARRRPASARPRGATLVGLRIVPRRGSRSAARTPGDR